MDVENKIGILFMIPDAHKGLGYKYSLPEDVPLSKGDYRGCFEHHHPQKNASVKKCTSSIGTYPHRNAHKGLDYASNVCSLAPCGRQNNKTTVSTPKPMEYCRKSRH